MKKTYVSPRIAVLRRSLNVMAGLDLYSQVGSGGQLGNEAIMDPHFVGKGHGDLLSNRCLLNTFYYFPLLFFWKIMRRLVFFNYICTEFKPKWKTREY